MRTIAKLCLSFLLLIFFCSGLYAQEAKKDTRLGISFGTGTQQFFPYNDPDYTHDVNSFSIQYNRVFFKKGKISFELQIEPGIYSVKHQLLNEYYLQPDAGEDYLQQREIFMKLITFTEYVINTGVQIRYVPKEKISLFLLAGIGPMLSGTETERLARGVAFSDIIAFGIAYRTKKLMFEIRPGIRHVSNAELKKPNSGHNSSNIDFGISLFL